jgi:antitoxin component YwqK of YwqJK toxin-antitoxin module
LFFLFYSLDSFSQNDTIIVDSKNVEKNIDEMKDGYYIFKNQEIILKEGTYKDKCAIGTWKFYYENGNLELLVDYTCSKNGNYEECGRYIEYYVSGQIKVEGNYEKLISDSIECVQCYNEIELKDVEWAISQPSLKIGFWKEYYENGKLKSIGKYYYGVHQTFNKNWQNGETWFATTLGTEYLKENEWNYYITACKR